MNMFNAGKVNQLFPNPCKVQAASDEAPANSRTLSAASAAAQEYSCEFGSTKYFALCGLGGVLSCGITHTMVTPLDLVKCRLQVNTQ